MTNSRRDPARSAAPAAGAPTEPAARRRAWLLLVHQLPAHPSNLRVRTWRRMQQIGALPVKQAVYLLPDTPATREDFEWLKTEIAAAGGEASVFVADTVDGWAHDALVDEFRRVRQQAYGAVAHDAEQLLKRLDGGRKRPAGGPPPRALQQLRERLAAIDRIDFFGSAGRDRALHVLAQIEARGAGGRPRAAADAGGGGVRAYHGRLWVTRPRPGVDRMASAWLIRRYIDPEARFDFAADRDAVPKGAIPFDMFGVEFSHQDDACTFETLCRTFAIGEPAVARLAAIVHDLDLKDERFGAPEAATVSTMIDGLQLAHADDHELLAHGMSLFNSLYRGFEQSARVSGPRPVAPPQGRRDAKSAPTPRRRRR